MSIQLQKVSEAIKNSEKIRLKIAEHILDVDGWFGDEVMWELAEEICVEAFGRPNECKNCDSGTLVYPGLNCYECGELNGTD
jgi:hypothetical protein